MVITDGLLDDIRSIISGSECKIRGFSGHGEPIASKDEISLNGDSETNESCESFILKPHTEFEYCKTSQMPYDKVVVAILLRILELDENGKFRVAFSDDSPDTSLFKKVFGREPLLFGHLNARF